MGDLLLIILIAVLLSGKGRLSQTGRELGEAVRNFKKAAKEPEEINITPGREEGKKD